MTNTVTFRLDENSIVAAARRHRTPLIRGLRLAALMLSGALALVMAVILLGLANSTMPVIGGFVACALIAVLLFLWLLRMDHVHLARRAFRDREALRAPMTLSWDSRTLTITTIGSTRQSPLSALVQFGLWPELLMLYPDPATYIAVPTHAFQAEALADLKSVLRAAGVHRLGPRD